MYLPKLATARPPSLAFLSWMLITPAIASEPYCDEAPSRSTSIRSIASVGMRLRSTAALPRPIVPLMLSRAETWRRLPLTRTRVWSGLRPRRVAGRSTSVPSAIEGCGKLNEGTSWLRTLLVSVRPVLVSASLPMTSIGTLLSATVRSVRRVPVTMITLAGSTSAWVWPGAGAGGASWAQAGAAARAIEDRVVSKPMRENRTMVITPLNGAPRAAGAARLTFFSGT